MGAVKSKSNDFDFGGYATKYNQLCSDGRKILPGAFQHSDGAKLPLVWRHLHDDPGNVLGHVVLEHRDDGVYVRGVFNTTKAGQNAKILVRNRDIVGMSIYANGLTERNKIVHSGNIREVSLVLSGANPGAKIDHINLQHADGTEDEIEDEAVIYGGEELDVLSETMVHADEEDEDKETMPNSKEKEEMKHANGEDKTVGDVFNSLTDEQKNVVYFLVAKAMEEDSEMKQSDDEGDNLMKRNVFDGSAGDDDHQRQQVLSHDEMVAIFEEAKNKRMSLKDVVLAHAGTYGIDNIGYLFPDAKAATKTPDWYKRDTTWVGGWMSGTRHLPFSRVKSWYADLTADEARAKGYTTGDQKIEEVFAILKRETLPQTVYKLQKLDRDDVIDINDFDVVAWMKQEMRFMLDEEIARASLVGDGRTFGVDDDAINTTNVRPIYQDDVLYSHKLSLEVTVVDYADIVDAIIGARSNYKGSNPNLYIAPSILTNFLLLKDTTGRRIYRSLDELARELRVNQIVEVEVLEGIQRTNTAPAFTADLLGIIVNPRDYSFGADKGGSLGMFDDFDIDFNQYKYLLETRLSGALTKVKTALCIERKTA